MRRRQDPSVWKPVKSQRRRSQWAVFVVLAVVWSLWLFWPVWGSGSAPNFDQAESEAPWVLAAQILGLAVLATAVWRDDERGTQTLSVVVLVVVADTALRLMLSPRIGGFEFVWVLPLLSGVARGAPVGFLVGGTSGLLSTLLAGSVGSPLAMQVAVWALAGAAGGLLHPVATRAARWLAIPFAVVLGVGVGLLLNLPGWSWSVGTTTADFVPGLPPHEVVVRLWRHTWETSFALDLTRGLVTATSVALLGGRLLETLRDTPVSWRVTSARDAVRVSPTALARRERHDAATPYWNQGEK